MGGWAEEVSSLPCASSSLAELEARELQCWEVFPAFSREDTRAQGTVCPAHSHTPVHSQARPRVRLRAPLRPCRSCWHVAEETVCHLCTVRASR